MVSSGEKERVANHSGSGPPARIRHPKSNGEMNTIPADSIAKNAGK